MVAWRGASSGTSPSPDEYCVRVRVLTVIGNRPQFVKAAAVSDRLRADAEEVLVHTGQHYDDELSRVFFEELELPRPEHHLDLGGGSNTSQTARMLAALEPLIGRERPDVVLVYGDTNSTMAGAVAGAQAGVPVAHVEAGMRSHDWTMPEELTRVLADHAAALLLCSSERSAARARGRGSRPRGCSRSSRRACGSSRRSATSSSRRCSSTRGPSSPTPAACRRRPTSRASRASRCGIRP